MYVERCRPSTRHHRHFFSTTHKNFALSTILRAWWLLAKIQEQTVKTIAYLALNPRKYEVESKLLYRVIVPKRMHLKHSCTAIFPTQLVFRFISFLNLFAIAVIRMNEIMILHDFIGIVSAENCDLLWGILQNNKTFDFAFRLLIY